MVIPMFTVVTAVTRHICVFRGQSMEEAAKTAAQRSKGFRLLTRKRFLPFGVTVTDFSKGFDIGLKVTDANSILSKIFFERVFRNSKHSGRIPGLFEKPRERIWLNQNG